MVDVSQTLANIAKAIVDNPDEVKVIIKEEDDEKIILELVVAPDDMGKVIGRKGKIAKALRTLVRVGSQKENKKYNIEIIERGEKE